jgi:hypothetical protein
MNNYTVVFQGYWRDENKDGIPSTSGVYIVYRGRYNNASNTIGLIEIIYIGQSDNVHDRIMNHEKRNLFEEKLLEGEELVYSFAPVKKDDLDTVEQSMIFAQKPVLNEKNKDSYQQDGASFKIEGECIGLKYTDYQITKQSKNAKN